MVLAVSLVSVPSAPRAQTNQAYEFAAEYIRGLGEIEALRIESEKEEKESRSDSAKMATCVRATERIGLEITSHIAILSGFRFGPPFEKVVPLLVSLYESKRDVHSRMGEICSAFLRGLRPGVDFGQIASDAPKLTAQLEHIDKTLLPASALVFSTLIDQRPDDQNHLSHLSIAAAERDRLVASLNSYFGNRLDEKNPNYAVGAAELLRNYLTKKGYKCSDEPW